MAANFWKQVALFELGNFRLDPKFVENLAGLTREALDGPGQVGGNTVRISRQPLKRVLGVIEELMFSFPLKQLLDQRLGLTL
jgi:hypothetical protein